MNEETKRFIKEYIDSKNRELVDYIDKKIKEIPVPLSDIDIDPVWLRTLKLYSIKIVASTVYGTTAQTSGNFKQFFIADRPYDVIGYSEVHRVAGSNAGAVTLNLEKLPSGTAPGSGSTLLFTAVSLKATANIPQFPVLTATKANLSLTKGDSLAHLIAGTLTDLENVCTTVILIEK